MNLMKYVVRTERQRHTARSTHFEFASWRLVTAAIASMMIAGIVSPAMASGNLQPVSSLDLSAYRGKVVYLDFWASWCGPCRLSFPFMNSLQWSFPDKNLVIITVDVDHDPAAAQQFLDKYGSGLPVYFDPKGQLAGKFNVSTMPTSIVIGKDGKVQYVHKGFFEADEPKYRQQLADLLHK
jgi:thiol-disulfide isomerase/thioredoxin